MRERIEGGNVKLFTDNKLMCDNNRDMEPGMTLAFDQNSSSDTKPSRNE